MRWNYKLLLLKSKRDGIFFGGGERRHATFQKGRKVWNLISLEYCKNINHDIFTQYCINFSHGKLVGQVVELQKSKVGVGGFPILKPRLAGFSLSPCAFCLCSSGLKLRATKYELQSTNNVFIAGLCWCQILPYRYQLKLLPILRISIQILNEMMFNQWH